MKSLLITFTVLFFFIDCIYSQISRTNVEFEKKIEIIVYDSTYNFPGLTPETLIGQTLYLRPEYDIRGNIVNYGEVGYSNFRLKPTTKVESDKKDKSIYLFKQTGRYSGGSDHTLLSNKSFKVLDVVRDEELRDLRDEERVFLKLFNDERDEEFYYLYPSEEVIRLYRIPDNRQFDWEFIVLGFYEKLTERLTGDSFVLKNSRYSWLNSEIRRVPLIDLVTGEDVKYKTGKKWNFVELTLNEQNKSKLSMILSDDDGQRIVLSIDYIYKLGLSPEMGIYTAEEYDSLFDKYGEKMLLALEGVVRIGFNEELTLLAISDYTVMEINTSVVGNIAHEQWVLGGNRYIYLENGIVTAFQF